MMVKFFFEDVASSIYRYWFAVVVAFSQK